MSSLRVLAGMLTVLATPAWGLGQIPIDILESQEKAMKAAAARLAPSVVQIETSGGSDVLGMTARGPALRKGTGPTTGVVVGADGYIISSAFNFANKPSGIFVAIPGVKERQVATVVATDQTRMLTLLKVPSKGLVVPLAAPKHEIQIGQWCLALGRTYAGPEQPPSMSAGIVSATNRIWGKAIQTDAKASPVNYGGPLIDLEGRVLGVLVPASPRSQDEIAGVEWYDSGIGFAIPFEDVLRVVPNLKKGKDLKRGMLGISIKGSDLYGEAPVIENLVPDGAALKAGIKVGDTVVEIDGKPILRQAQILQAIGGRYEGDIISVKVRRDGKEVGFAKVVLTAGPKGFVESFLGVLPIRDDPDLGEEIRYVFPGSPAEAARLEAGDRILKVGIADSPPRPFSGRDQLTDLLGQIPPGTEIKLEIARKSTKKTETITLRLGVLREDVPDQLPEEASRKQALAERKAAPQPMKPRGGDPKAQEKPKELPKKGTPKKEESKKAETGLLKRSTAAGDHQYWLYVPADYDPNASYSLVVWLHPAGKPRDKDRDAEQLISNWEDFCSAQRILLLCPKAESETGWIASEADFVLETIRALQSEYTIDSRRIVAHGMGVGGQFAYYLGLTARDVFRGVAAVSAALNYQIKEATSQQRLAFFLVAGGKDPLLPAIQEGRDKLTEFKFPVVYHEIAEMGHEYLDAVTLRELIRWVDSLDRQ